VHDGTPGSWRGCVREIEAGAAQADLRPIADSVTMEGAEKDGRLLAHESADVSACPAGVHDPWKSRSATKLVTTGIVHDAKVPLAPSGRAVRIAARRRRRALASLIAYRQNPQARLTNC